MTVVGKTSGQTIEGASKIAAVIQFPQAPKWANRGNPPPGRRAKGASHTREYLTDDEVERMVVAARRRGGGRAERDAMLIMVVWRHGLRCEQVDLKAGLLHVAPLKHDSSSTHPLRGPELRALRAWKRKQGEGLFLLKMR